MRYSAPKTAARYNPARSRQGPAEVTRTFQQILSVRSRHTPERQRRSCSFLLLCFQSSQPLFDVIRFKHPHMACQQREDLARLIRRDLSSATRNQNSRRGCSGISGGFDFGKFEFDSAVAAYRNKDVQ